MGNGVFLIPLISVVVIVGAWVVSITAYNTTAMTFMAIGRFIKSLGNIVTGRTKESQALSTDKIKKEYDELIREKMEEVEKAIKIVGHARQAGVESSKLKKIMKDIKVQQENIKDLQKNCAKALAELDKLDTQKEIDKAMSSMSPNASKEWKKEKQIRKDKLRAHAAADEMARRQQAEEERQEKLAKKTVTCCMCDHIQPYSGSIWKCDECGETHSR